MPNEDEGNLEPTGDETESQSQTSGDSGQPLPTDVEKVLQEQAEKIATLTKQFAGIQKSEDTINARVEAKVDDFTAQIGRITELQAEGKNKAEIARELRLDALLEGNSTPSAVSGDTQTNGQSLDTDSIARSLDLPANHPKVNQLQVDFQGNPSGFLDAGLKLKQELAATSSPPAPGEAPMQDGNTTPDPSSAELLEKYKIDLQAVPQGTQGRTQFLDVKEKYRKLGVDVDNVGWK